MTGNIPEKRPGGQPSLSPFFALCYLKKAFKDIDLD
jgi:hypothetical protein